MLSKRMHKMAGWLAVVAMMLTTSTAHAGLGGMLSGGLARLRAVGGGVASRASQGVGVARNFASRGTGVARNVASWGVGTARNFTQSSVGVWRRCAARDERGRPDCDAVDQRCRQRREQPRLTGSAVVQRRGVNVGNQLATGTVNVAGRAMLPVNGTQDQQLAAIKAYGGPSVWGGPKIEPHYAAAWAWAGNTPFQWGKQVASHLGGTRDPLVVSWPKAISDGGGLRSQFVHVTDIVPTLLEAAKVPAPRLVDGAEQMPMHGVSFLQTTTNADAPTRHAQQYFEILGNRAMYKDGWWLACRLPRIPWKLDPATLTRFAPGRWDPDADPCELYDLTTDFSQAHDLAAQRPDKVAELRSLFWEEAARYRVTPLLGGMAIAFGDAYQRPQPATARYTYRQGVENLSPGVIPPIYNRSFAIDADIDVMRNECLLVVCSGAEGVIVAEGDYLGGFSLYVMHGKPRFTYSFLGLKIDTLEGTEPLPVGRVRLRYEFVADAPGEKATEGLGDFSSTIARSERVGSSTRARPVHVVCRHGHRPRQWPPGRARTPLRVREALCDADTDQDCRFRPQVSR